VKSLFFLFIFVSSLVSSLARASGADRRFIEMPYGPGPGERVLKTEFSYSGSENRASFFSIGAEYEQSLNDEFALVWGPLPLGVIIRDPSQTGIDQSACRWSLDLYQRGVFGLQPRFNGYLRRAISSSQAFDIELEYFSFFPFSQYPMIWTVGLKSNYISQLSDSVALWIGASVWANDTILLQTYDRQSSANSDFNLSLPIRLGTDFRLSSSLHLELEYEFRGIGLTDRYRTHTVVLRPTFRW
jgi:opacity protein-like surface antigen